MIHSSDKRNRHLGVGTAAAWLTIAAATMCGCEQRTVPYTKEMHTKNTLREVCMLITSEEWWEKEKAPTKVSELVAWLARNMDGEILEQHNIDKEGQTIRDAWDRPIVLLVKQGELVGVGSAGLNGKWEGGSGDDIVCPLDEVRQPDP